MNKMNENNAKNKRDGKGSRKGQQANQNAGYGFSKGKRSMSNKSRDKIIKGSKPTRSKVISKGKRR